MKLSAFVAIAAVIGGSFLISNPADANCQPGRDVSGCTSSFLAGIDIRQNMNYGSTNSTSSCPPGTSHYRTKGLFGIGARDIGCMTAYEAESLHRQNLNRNRTRNCTTNFIGNTAYTNCY